MRSRHAVTDQREIKVEHNVRHFSSDKLTFWQGAQFVQPHEQHCASCLARSNALVQMMQTRRTRAVGLCVLCELRGQAQAFGSSAHEESVTLVKRNPIGLS